MIVSCKIHNIFFGGKWSWLSIVCYVHFGEGDDNDFGKDRKHTVVKCSKINAKTVDFTAVSKPRGRGPKPYEHRSLGYRSGFIDRFGRNQKLLSFNRFSVTACCLKDVPPDFVHRAITRSNRRQFPTIRYRSLFA